MKFTITEMNGLLNGKCIPTDLLVGETLSSYLVRKLSLSDQLLIESDRYGRQADITIENLERKVEQLAAENAGLKTVVSENWNLRDVLRQLIAGRPGGYYFIKWEPLIFKALNETPATDAYLAEVRAQGVQMFAAEMGAIHAKCQGGGYFDRQVQVYGKAQELAESYLKQRSQETAQ